MFILAHRPFIDNFKPLDMFVVTDIKKECERMRKNILLLLSTPFPQFLSFIPSPHASIHRSSPPSPPPPPLFPAPEWPEDDNN